MSLMNFGLYQGLSAAIPYENMMDRETKLASVRRQTRVDAENKAKLLGDDMKMATMTSDFQREKLNGFYSEHMKKIGDFVIQNPDMQTNPAKMMQFNQLKHQMLDNPIVAADMRFKTESDALTKFISENPDTWKDDPEVIELLNARDSYNKYGTTTPGKGQSEFIFINPDSKVNLTGELQKHFSAIEYDNNDPIFGNQKDGSKQWVSEDRMYEGGKSFLESNPKFSRMAQNMFKNLRPEDQKKYVDAAGNPDVAMWIKDQGKMFVKPTKVESAVDFKPTADKSSGGADDQTTNGQIDYFKDILSEATKYKGTWRTGNANGLRKALMSDGKANLSGGELLTINGERFTENDSDNVPALGDTDRTALIATKYATPTGEIKIDSNGQSKARWLIEMPIDEFASTFPQYNDAIDHGTIMGSDTMRAMNDKWTDQPSTVFKIIERKGEDGKTTSMVQFNLQAPLVDNETNTNYTMNSAYNAGVDGLTKVAGVDNTIRVGQRFTTPDGLTWEGFLAPDGSVKTRTIN